jgi:adenylate cyclase
VLFDTIVVALFWVIAFVLFHNHRVLIELLPPSLALFATSWITDGLGGQEARRQREFIRSSFSQYVPPTVVKELVERPDRLSLRGERREITMIFTDVSEFTAMSEGLGAQQLGVLVNQYLTEVCQVLFEHAGTVLKFMGDGTFAIFNAPIDQPDHPERAVRCALQLDRVTQAFSARQTAMGIPFGATRIGIHTGDASVGNFGSISRKEYGAMGNAVNTAARIEGINKSFGTRICVSDATADRCPAVAFRPLAEVILKGKSVPIAVHEPLQPGQFPADFIDAYKAAYQALSSHDPQALALFEALDLKHPGDRPTQLHLDRLRRGQTGVAIRATAK